LAGRSLRFYAEDGFSTFLSNIGKDVPYYTHHIPENGHGQEVYESAKTPLMLCLSLNETWLWLSTELNVFYATQG
jgi:hypothetical protein